MTCEMDIVEYAERILGLTLYEFQKEYLRKTWESYKKPKLYYKTYPCYTPSSRQGLLADILVVDECLMESEVNNEENSNII